MELKQIKTLAILELLTKPNNNPDPKNKKIAVLRLLTESKKPKAFQKNLNPIKTSS